MALAEPLVKKGSDETGPSERTIFVADDAANAPQKYCGNAVSTAKYSFFPLLPSFIVYKSLFEQFHKAANVYFLLISALQLVPGLSPTGRFTTLIPLCFVLTVTMLKDAFEDLKRHRSDKELNDRHTHARIDGAWKSITWTELKVGQLCKVTKGQAFPADLVVVWSSEPEGMCYIETANLDGETNLKIRKAPGALYKNYNALSPEALAATLVCEQPNNRLYNFDGYYEKAGKQKVSLNADNLLLRGANLRNTKEVVGIVVFTGDDTKLMRNSSAKASKMSTMDHVTNKQIGLVFAAQLIICLGCTIGATVLSTSLTDHWYLYVQGAGNAGLVFIASFGTFLILYNNLIPISLYVTMEMVKLFQAGLINNDVEMYHDETDTPASARTSALNEELGQVEYIFSDKTGTLTCNIMDFLKFTCQKYDPFTQKTVVCAYGTGTTEIGRAAAQREGRELKDDRPAGFVPQNGFYFYDPRVSDRAWTAQENADQLQFFLQFLAVCHTVIPEKENGELVYQAASPDEGCLVKGAAELGVKFLGRTDSSVTIDVCGSLQTWEVLNTIEFNSTRKRMSVIVRDPRGKLMLLCKGADTVIYERLRADLNDLVRGDTLELLTRFAAEGLRTLVLAKLDLDEISYLAWARKYHEASTSITDRANKMSSVAEEIERGLDLVGTTAIEDKLQGKVPDTIELLAQAGIKIWVLTGDKQETAINIGFACALLHNEMGLFMFDDVIVKQLRSVLVAFLSDAKAVVDQDLGLIIQGDMLHHVLPPEGQKNTPISDLFLQLATRCKAVICCRVSPLQKAQVVKLVRDNIATVTLAIGDGANDVAMIQAAHVGIGISGMEGLQAARASDYSIAQFRFLGRLLLLHGRYSYRRISKLILYCFYKNVTLYLTQMWFAIFNQFSGTSLYDSWSLSFYNLVFSAFPIIALAVLDRDVEPIRSVSKDQFPELYLDGINSRIFNTLRFWLYLLNSFLQSLLCFVIPLFICQFFSNAQGQQLGLPGTGITIYTIVLFTVTSKVGIETQSWTIPNVVVCVFSLGAWYAFLGVYGNLYSVAKVDAFADWYGLPSEALSHPVYWLTVLLVVLLVLLRDFLWKTWAHNFNQQLMHVIQELEHAQQKFSRRDVLRITPQLLPKFLALKPFEPLPEEREIEMGSITRTFAKLSKDLFTQGTTIRSEADTKPGAGPKRSGPRAQFFSTPGRTKIGTAVCDDFI